MPAQRGALSAEQLSDPSVLAAGEPAASRDETVAAVRRWNAEGGVPAMDRSDADDGVRARFPHGALR